MIRMFGCGRTCKHQEAIEKTMRQLLDQLANQPMIVKVDGKEIARAVDVANRKAGRST